MLASLVSQSNEPSQTCHSIVFRVLDQFLALPIDVIVKVSRAPEYLENPELKSDFMMFNDQFVKLINLHDLVRRFHSSQSNSSRLKSSRDVSTTAKQFLILTKVHAQHLSGFFVDDVPYMLDVPISSIHPFPIPTSKHISEVLSHVAILSDHKNKTIFLLNLKNI